VNPKNDEGRPLKRPTAKNIAAENVPRLVAGVERANSNLAAMLLLEEAQTPLPRSLRALRRALADARKMDERSRLVFASVGARTFANRFGPELVIAEAERALQEAA
jgi:hypothetical protein